MHSFVTHLVFKQALHPKPGWFVYLCALVVLVLISIIRTKKKKINELAHLSCRIIAKKQLGLKSVLYVIEVQNQKFLLAENPHALAFQKIDSELNPE